MKLINIGFGSMVAAGRVLSILAPDSAPIKRIVTRAKENECLVDATYGRRTKAVIIMDTEHVILSPIHPETINGRLESLDNIDEDEDEEDE